VVQEDDVAADEEQIPHSRGIPIGVTLPLRPVCPSATPRPGRTGGAPVRQHYLRDAPDAALAGRLPATAETKPVGCTIKWK